MDLSQLCVVYLYTRLRLVYKSPRIVAITGPLHTRCCDRSLGLQNPKYRNKYLNIPTPKPTIKTRQIHNRLWTYLVKKLNLRLNPMADEESYNKLLLYELKVNLSVRITTWTKTYFLIFIQHFIQICLRQNSNSSVN